MAAKKKTSKKAQVKLDTKMLIELWGKVSRIVVPLIIALLVFLLVDLLVQYLNNDYSIAVVNGVRVPRRQFVQRMESAYGEQAVGTLVDEYLITQAASDEGVEVTDEQIQERLDEIVASIGGEELLDTALENNNITLDDLKRQIELDVMAREIIEPDIEYSDDDLKEFFELYKTLLFSEEEDVTFEDKKAEVEEAYVNQKFEENKATWLQDLRDEAKIQNNVTEKPTYGFLTVTRNIVSNLLNSAKSEE
jgi:parvulin-like peptidyl-prolyl isomerase